MLTITTEKHTLYINIDLLKGRLKNASTTILKVLITVLTIAGILVIIDTAEALNNYNIPLSEISVLL